MQSHEQIGAVKKREFWSIGVVLSQHLAFHRRENLCSLFCNNEATKRLTASLDPWSLDPWSDYRITKRSIANLDPWGLDPWSDYRITIWSIASLDISITLTLTLIFRHGILLTWSNSLWVEVEGTWFMLSSSETGNVIIIVVLL